MADRERKKALFRAKLNEKQQSKKRIDSPLVRYNDQDRPVCRVCDVVLKSDSDWVAHQASRKHHEAINNLKANASRKNVVNNPKIETSRETPKPPDDQPVKSSGAKPAISSDKQKSRPSAVLPADFFDDQEAKRQNAGPAQVGQVDGTVGDVPSKAAIPSKDEIKQTRVAENVNDGSGAKQIKGALPEGFFDNKDADLRARGIEPVKPDIKDEYKEFEKLIQENLAEVDNRLEEEEVDAAEFIEEEEMVEQRSYRDRVEMLKRKKAELISARYSKATSNASDVARTKSDQDGSSSEDDDDESFAVDWRAQHL